MEYKQAKTIGRNDCDECALRLICDMVGCGLPQGYHYEELQTIKFIGGRIMEMTINEFCSRFLSGEFNTRSHLKQLEAGWYDWWCVDSALPHKTMKLGRKVCAIRESKRFDADKTYVFFKNNCPMVGPLYDQFSICDIKTGDVLFCAQHLEKGSHGCEHAHWELYDAKVGFREPVVNGTWNEVKKYFMN